MLFVWDKGEGEGGKGKGKGKGKRREESKLCNSFVILRRSLGGIEGLETLMYSEKEKKRKEKKRKEKKRKEKKRKEKKKERSGLRVSQKKKNGEQL